METRDHHAPATPSSSVLHGRLTAYSTLAVAGACAVAAAPNSAQADIAYSGALNLSVAVSVSGVYINLANFTTYASLTAAQAADATAPILNLWGTSNTYSYFYPTTSTVNRFVSTGANPLELAAGVAVNGTSTYGTTRAPGALTTGLWTAGTTGYLGFRMLNGTTTEYGWVQIQAQAPPTAAAPIKVFGIAYENTGGSILTGQTSAVPEPGTVAFLAAGAVGTGMMVWRRRKAA
jgi:hypothetical protein